MADTTVVQFEKMTTTTSTKCNVPCASANCFGPAKRLSLLRSSLKRCGLCDARRLFRRMFKCFECKTAFHRRCASKALCKREPAVGLHHHAPAAVCGIGVRENFPANLKTTTAAAAATVTTTTETTINDIKTNEQTLHHAPAEVCGDGVRENFPANPDTTTTTTTAAAIIAETTDHHCVPPIQCTEITSLEYFKFVLEETSSQQDKIHLKEATASPSPVRNPLMRAETSAASDEPTFIRNKNRVVAEHRVVHSMTVKNSSKRRPRRVTFGNDPTLKSDRWIRKHPLGD